MGPRKRATATLYPKLMAVVRVEPERRTALPVIMRARSFLEPSEGEFGKFVSLQVAGKGCRTAVARRDAVEAWMSAALSPSDAIAGKTAAWAATSGVAGGF